MLFRFLAAILPDDHNRVNIFKRTNDAGNVFFLVRPGVVLVEKGKVRFRNFTEYVVTIKEADFLERPEIKLDKAGTVIDGEKTDRKKVNLADKVQHRFYEYKTFVTTDQGDVEASGDSRPGAIIDR